jgi:mRNA interferase RelE/StbE
MPYRVRFNAHGERAFAKLTLDVRGRIAPQILALGEDPRPDGCRKLTGGDSVYRIRVGDYRVVYEVRDSDKVVVVTDAAPRDKVYKNR